LDLCLCVVVVGVVVVGVVVVGVLLVAGVEEELAPLPPHPATAAVAASAAAAVSMAVSGVLLMGRDPIVARGHEGSPYQPFAVPVEP
jgi:hypothetical protein